MEASFYQPYAIPDDQTEHQSTTSRHLYTNYETRI